ncbi:MAG: HAD family hydrolase [Rhodobacteraceae bacterium]|nr:HAD family hydrolase [Paracoccaceae bacterium]
MDLSTRADHVGAVLFDKDGTLFDFRATWEAWAMAFLMRVCDDDTARATRMGAAIGFDVGQSQFDPASIAIAGTPGEIAAALAPFLPHLSLSGIIALLNDEAAQAPQIEAVPLAPFLGGLRDAGLRLGVATNDAEAPALAHLARAGVADRFDFIAGFDSGHGAKPGPGQLLAFAAAVSVPPARIVMVGDSTHDMIAARSAGMIAVAVLTGMAQAAELAPHADAVLPGIGHLPQWLGLAGAERWL